jgi:hypothetical protein
MCDYSLYGVKNRLAVEGESLVTHKFHTGCRGLAPAADVERIRPHSLIELVRHWSNPETYWEAEKKIPAVCIPHGARLLLEGIPRHAQKVFGIGETEEVTFLQLSYEPYRYRDAFQFDHRLLLPLDPDRACDVLSLQNLPEGICVEVLALELQQETVSTGAVVLLGHELDRARRAARG